MQSGGASEKRNKLNFFSKNSQHDNNKTPSTPNKGSEDITDEGRHKRNRVEFESDANANAYANSQPSDKSNNNNKNNHLKVPGNDATDSGSNTSLFGCDSINTWRKK